MSKGRVGGAGSRRPGATDTTMLVWKTIYANPGITRDEIFAKIEHQIPAGWAKRLYINYHKITSATPSAEVILRRARRHALNCTLAHMRQYGSAERSTEGGYRTIREIRQYAGDAAAVDETGTRAAEHLDYAYALRTAEAAIARAHDTRFGVRVTRAEWAAIVKVVKRARS